MRMLAKRVLSAVMGLALLVSLFPAALASEIGAETASENTPPIFQSAKNYGSPATDALHDVAYTSDGGFVAMGYSFGESADPAWTHTGSGSNNDAILLKFDSEHRVQWAKAYGDTGVDVFNSMDVLTDGRIVALGRSSYTSGDESMKGVCWYLLVINPDDPEDYVDYRIGGSSGDQGYSVAATSDGGFVAAGWTASKTGFITHSTDRVNYLTPVQLWESADGTDDTLPNRISSSGSDSVVVRFDAAGNVLYTALHNYGVSENEYNISTPSERLEAAAVDADDNIYLTGYDAVAKNAQNAFIAKLNAADGSLLWHRSAGRLARTVVPEDAAEYIKAVYSGVSVLTDQSVVVTGTSTGDATTQEDWKITGVKDTLVVRYSADGELLFSDTFGTIDDNDSRPEGVIGTPDGGYIVYGSQSGVMVEDSLVDKGYNWGSYGGQDAILVKYSPDNTVEWAENYGTGMGDWINGLAIREDGEIIAVGESNGQNGNPAWGNNGGIDGVIMCTTMYPEAYTEPINAAVDGNVVWADGSYTDTGNGFGGADSVEVTVTVEGGQIVSVSGANRRDTAQYYTRAEALHDTITQRQSANVDGVSGATYSSTGIKEAASKALGQSAAAYVDGLIAAIATAENGETAVRTAADAYAELGAYSVTQLKNLADLQAAAESYGIALTSRADQAQSLTETLPESGTGLRHNDTYYKLQNHYYRNIHAEALENNDLTGEGVRIAVIDSGLTPAHQDLDYTRVLDGYDYDNNAPMGVGSLVDNNGHGTEVTGILAAVTDNGIGVAGLFSKLQIIPLKVTPVSPSKDTDGASSKQVARAITDAVDKFHADVITTSLDVKDTEELAQAVAYAASKNVIITGASGNSSTSDDDPYIYPASYADVISVGAVDAQNTVRANSQKNDQVFVTAPGEDIAVPDLSTSARCKLASGTSYASPIVAAMAVAAKQYNPDITPEQFKTLLRTSSIDAGPEGYDNAYGYGIVDFAAFVSALTGTDIPSDDSPYTDGVWQGTAFGYLSDITVAVTIEDGKIKTVEAVSNRESPMFFQMASAVMTSIVEQQTTDVDTVTGATYSSTGIINAVRQALERAANPNAEIYTTPQAAWFADGDGTQSDPFLIRTKEQLMKLSTTVDDVIDYAGYYVQLDADLDLSGANWRTIGGGVYAFNGTFDGANHTISGLTLGTNDRPYTLDSSIRTIGLFGILGPDALVKDLNLTDVQANVYSEGQIRLGALAGHANGSEENYGGAVINHCTVRGGYLKAETEAAGNSFVGGLTGYLTGGAIINSMTDVEITSTTKYWYAEAGGISGINNAGLVANCYALGTSTGNDGGGVDTDVAASVLVGMQMGDLVNCYADGDIYANEPSNYSGAVSGWVTDGRSYNSWYNAERVLELGGTRETMKAYGAKDSPTMDYDGLYYINNMVRELNAYSTSTKSTVADALNGTFAAFPIDISVYGVGNQDLRTWVYDSASGEITFTDTPATVTYVMPEDENVEQVYQPMKDGVWYGRDPDKTTVVRIITSDDKITATDVLQGQNSGDAYDAALKKAQQKAIYGDTTDYNSVDTSSLQGSGTESAPYLISTAADLRLIAQAINEDQSWEGAYFRQTADIDVSDEEWLPIGWAIQGYYRSRWTQFCEYPFEGNYDGGGFTVSGVHIGAPGQPTSDTRKAFTAGFFGVTRGTVNDNYAIASDARLVTITNLHLRDVAIDSASHGNNFAGGLIAEPVSGFRVDKCSVEGTVSAAAETGVIYAGGLMGYALRGGLITNTWTNVEVSASSSRESDGGNVYAGGLYGYDNRVTTVNAFTLGSVTGDGKENSVMVGGVSGANGGAHYNTYAMGDITARNTTNYIGGLDGWLPAIGADYHGYYNSDAVQTVNGAAVSAKKAVGVSSQAEARDHTESKSKSQMQSADFAGILNANRETIADELSPLQEAIGYHPLHTVYYTGNGSDLDEWTVSGGVVTMGVPTVVTYAVRVTGGTGSGEYKAGDSVSISADVPDGKTFERWTGADGLQWVSGGADTADAVFTMPAEPVSVTAVYADIAETVYHVSVSGGTGSGDYKAGDSVSISADVPDGKTFKRWSGAGSLQWIRGGVTSPDSVFTMPERNVSLNAAFSTPDTPGQQSQQGCYVATAVYGSYDCPEVWTLRRFRDNVLAKTWYGRLFIHLYYAVSPTAVKLFGGTQWFQDFWRARLDTMVSDLQANGFASTPYQDKAW